MGCLGTAVRLLIVQRFELYIDNPVQLSGRQVPPRPCRVGVHIRCLSGCQRVGEVSEGQRRAVRARRCARGDPGDVAGAGEVLPGPSTRDELLVQLDGGVPDQRVGDDLAALRRGVLDGLAVHERKRAEFFRVQGDDVETGVGGVERGALSLAGRW